jgi:cupin fold WbuC family metalloprotein
VLNLKMKSTEVYEVTDQVVHVSEDELAFLSRAIGRSPRRRARICTHKSIDERLHEMFVIYHKETYVRPNRHFGKDESVFVIKGEADFVFFDDKGAITDIVRMGDPSTGKAYYCRVPAQVFHTILIRSDEIVLFEATPGPFDPSDTAYADWAPAEHEREVVSSYRNELDRLLAVDKSQRTLHLDTINAQVLVTKDAIVPLSQREDDFLKGKLRREHLDRLRICCHRTTDDRLHEMLMVFSGDTYIRPSLHIDKEESLFILEGFGTYLFFDEHGCVTQRIALGPIGSGRSFYCRIPANTYHCLLIEGDHLLAKETTSGPFSRQDTHFAAWSPDGSDRDGVRNYLDSLRGILRQAA